MVRPRVVIISKDKLKDLYLRKKLSPAQIAKRFNCGQRVIYTRLYEYNIPIRHNRERRDIIEEKLRDLYLDKKMSIGKIAGMFNCSKGTIWAKLCQYNIDVRTKSEANKGKYRVEISEEALRDLYINKTLDTNEIARKFNCGATTIVRRLHCYDIPIRRTKIDIPLDRLVQLYVNKEKTIYQIAQKFNCDAVTVLNRLNQYNIPIRKKGEIWFREENQEIKIPKDKLKHFYVNKGLTISEIVKMFRWSRGTVYRRLKRYGFIRSVSKALKGNPSPMEGKHHTVETRKKLSLLTIKQLASGRMNKKNTSIETKFEEELKRNQIHYQKHISLCSITVPDFYLPDYKIVIYVDGDYWHNLPMVKKRDKKQSKILTQKGYQVLRFWEHEINKSVSKCVNKIKKYV